MEKLSRVEFIKYIAPVRHHCVFVESMRHFSDAFATAKAGKATLCNFCIPHLSAEDLKEVGSLTTKRECSFVRIDKHEIEAEGVARQFWVVKIEF